CQHKKEQTQNTRTNSEQADESGKSFEHSFVNCLHFDLSEFTTKWLQQSDWTRQFCHNTDCAWLQVAAAQDTTSSSWSRTGFQTWLQFIESPWIFTALS